MFVVHFCHSSHGRDRDNNTEYSSVDEKMQIGSSLERLIWAAHQEI